MVFVQALSRTVTAEKGAKALFFVYFGDGRTTVKKFIDGYQKH
jgi:hypothetical protein